MDGQILSLMATRSGTRSVAPGANVPVSTAVIEAISSLSGRSALDLPPMYSTIDPDALDALFEDRLTDGNVTFRYADHLVTVHADRTIEIAPLD